MKKTINERIVLLSHIINEETPFYGGKRYIRLEQAKSIDKGDSCNIMKWSISNHIGTHVDAPLHFIKGGSPITDFGPASWFFENILLVETDNAPPGYIITKKDMHSISDCELLLVKTGFEKYRGDDIYWQDSPGLHPDLAEWLKRKSPSIRAVGIDFISISNLNNRELGRKAHRSFLENDILLIEDMKLSSIEKAPAKVIIAPLLVEKADGSPCTVFGMDN